MAKGNTNTTHLTVVKAPGSSKWTEVFTHTDLKKATATASEIQSKLDKRHGPGKYQVKVVTKEATKPTSTTVSEKPMTVPKAPKPKPKPQTNLQKMLDAKPHARKATPNTKSKGKK